MANDPKISDINKKVAPRQVNKVIKLCDLGILAKQWLPAVVAVVASVVAVCVCSILGSSND